jgi:stage V sporulation protein SpoVS
MTNIPDGYGVIAGRSRKNAQAALEAADAAGVERSLVVAVNEGYLVPEAVLDAFHAPALTETEVEADKNAAEARAEADVPGDVYPTSDWKNAEIESWAEANGVDLDGATKKADMLAAIAAATGKE